MPSLTIEDRDLDNRGRVRQRAAGPPQRTSFSESSTERSRRLAALTKRKQRSQCTVEAKRARREHEKVQKKKARCGESSQTRYKLCSLFMLDSTVVDFNRALTIKFLTSHFHMAYPHAQWHGAARGIMRMRSPGNEVRARDQRRH